MLKKTLILGLLTTFSFANTFEEKSIENCIKKESKEFIYKLDVSMYNDNFQYQLLSREYIIQECKKTWNIERAKINKSNEITINGIKVSINTKKKKQKLINGLYRNNFIDSINFYNGYNKALYDLNKESSKNRNF